MARWKRISLISIGMVLIALAVGFFFKGLNDMDHGDLQVLHGPHGIKPLWNMAARASAVLALFGTICVGLAFQDMRKPLKKDKSMWKCPSCGERSLQEFDCCWKCGTHRRTDV